MTRQSPSPAIEAYASATVPPLRLLFSWVEEQVGYEEICWNEEFAAPPPPRHPPGETINRPYQDWLQATFGATIPATALEIVSQPTEMGDTATTDAFCHWVNQLTG